MLTSTTALPFSPCKQRQTVNDCTHFLISPRHVSFHIISVECLKMWFIEGTQRGSVGIQQVVHTVCTLSALPHDQCQSAFLSERKCFHCSAFWKKKKKKKNFFQFKVKRLWEQLPSARPLPPSSSCWRWHGTDLSGQPPAALPVRWRKSTQPLFS